MIEFDVGEVECYAWGFRICRLSNADEEEGTEGKGGCYCGLAEVSVRRGKGHLFVDDRVFTEENDFSWR